MDDLAPSKVSVTAEVSADVTQREATTMFNALVLRALASNWHSGGVVVDESSPAFQMALLRRLANALEELRAVDDAAANVGPCFFRGAAASNVANGCPLSVYGVFPPRGEQEAQARAQDEAMWRRHVRDVLMLPCDAASDVAWAARERRFVNTLMPPSTFLLHTSDGYMRTPELGCQGIAKEEDDAPLKWPLKIERLRDKSEGVLESGSGCAKTQVTLVLRALRKSYAETAAQKWDNAAATTTGDAGAAAAAACEDGAQSEGK